MLFDLDNDAVKEYIRQAEFGIERESLRINADGTLAQTPHPFEEHKNIDRDFCENQVEMISDVFDAPQKLYNQLIELPKLEDYLTREALRQDSLSYFMKLSILRLQSVTPADNTLEFRYTSLDYIGEEADRYRSWIKSDPIIYTWTGKRFKRK